MVGHCAGLFASASQSRGATASTPSSARPSSSPRRGSRTCRRRTSAGWTATSAGFGCPSGSCSWFPAAPSTGRPSAGRRSAMATLARRLAARGLPRRRHRRAGGGSEAAAAILAACPGAVSLVGGTSLLDDRRHRPACRRRGRQRYRPDAYRRRDRVPVARAVFGGVRSHAVRPARPRSSRSCAGPTCGGSPSMRLKPLYACVKRRRLSTGGAWRREWTTECLKWPNQHPQAAALP